MRVGNNSPSATLSFKSYYNAKLAIFHNYQHHQGLHSYAKHPKMLEIADDCWLCKMCWEVAEGFPRLSVNGPFHRLLGWIGVLIIVFFHQKWQWIGFSWKESYETCFVYFATLSKQLTTIKCFQKKTTALKIFKTSQLFVIFWTKPFILPKKFVKGTICRQRSKSLAASTLKKGKA